MTKTYEYGGVRVGNELRAFVTADETIRPLRQQIVVEPLAWEPSKILEVVYQGKTLRGRVLAVGPGRYLIQYASGNPPQWHPVHHPPPKGQRTASRESTVFRPTDVKVGDLVEFGGLEIRGYLLKTVMWAGREVVICDEDDVAIVCEQDAA